MPSGLVHEAGKSGAISRDEDKKWNMISEKMSAFHDFFKAEFDSLYELADGSFHGKGLSLPRYLDTAKAMNHHLTMHHTIEERYLFPILAKSMPQFANRTDADTHISSHQAIHKGLVKLNELVEKWTDAPSTYSPTEMRACLDSFKDVLFHHLDEEVADLQGKNLKRYLTLEELENLPI